jgi:DNA-binding XRE family transcriptional regulator
MGWGTNYEGWIVMFTAVFRENRVRLGLTQSQVAEAVGVSKTAVYMWESGRGCPTLANLVACERLFGVAPGVLLIPCAYI